MFSAASPLPLLSIDRVLGFLVTLYADWAIRPARPEETECARALAAVVVPRATNLPTPPPMAPITPSIATSLQFTSPSVTFCHNTDIPPAFNAPLAAAMIVAPTGPPIPVHIKAAPATTIAPPAMYSQLLLTQFLALANTP